MWLADFNAGRTQLVSFDRSNTSGNIHVKMDGSALEEKYLSICWHCLSFQNWTGAFTLFLSPEVTLCL